VTIEALAAAQDGTEHQDAIADAREKIRACDAKMARYRAAIDAGRDIAEITAWINAAKAERVQAEADLRGIAPPKRMTREDVQALVEHFASIGAILASADLAGKAAPIGRIHPCNQHPKWASDLGRGGRI